MKKIQFFWLLSIFIGSTIFGVGFVGCSTTPVQTTVKAEGILIASVDVGMNLWHDYVVAHLADGKVTQKQIDTVKQAYQTYYNAQQIAKAAIEKQILMANTTGTFNASDVQDANNAVAGAEQSLLFILNQYVK